MGTGERSRDGRPGVAGMTLLEVLASIFILGMGLIMVAGAFPVGADQTVRSARLTEMATLGRSAVEISRSQKYIRNLPGTHYSAGTSRPRGKDNEPWRVWNANRWAYEGNMTDSKMWPPQKGDYLWRAFLTRLSGLDEAPLFRMTVVVAKFDYATAPGGVGWYLFAGWELFNPQAINSMWFDPGQPDNDGDNPTLIYAGVTTRSCSGATGRKLSINPMTFGSQIRAGDYVMDMRTGLCYRIERFFPSQTTTETAILGSDPVPPFPTGGCDFIFLKSVQAIYTTTWSE